jgi:hypothetical protein
VFSLVLFSIWLNSNTKGDALLHFHGDIVDSDTYGSTVQREHTVEFHDIL